MGWGSGSRFVNRENQGAKEMEHEKTTGLQ